MNTYTPARNRSGGWRTAPPMERLKRLQQLIVRSVLRCTLQVLVVLLYLFGFSLTWLGLLLFERRVLFPRCGDDGSWWTPARGYEASLEEWAHPS